MYLFAIRQCAHAFLTSSLCANLALTFDLQWDAVEDKPTVLLYGGGAIVALWLTSVVVGAINAVPLVCSCSVRIREGTPGYYSSGILL